MTINPTPKGGTELQLEYLTQYVDLQLLSKVQITTSVPEKIPLSKDKINILWQKNSWDQPNIYPWFKDKDNHTKYDWYVFNSHWNFENFTKKFDLDRGKCMVIKNGISKIEPAPVYEKDKPIKIIHQITPWRGLNVLLGAMQLVNHPLITLDVYSSTEIYGKAFYEQNDKEYKGLYEQAKQLKNVNYIGYKPNSYIKEHLKDYHMFVYPSIWEETSCISAIESMAAGLYTIVTNLGALAETCSEFGIYVPYDNNHRRLAFKFAQAIKQGAEAITLKPIQDHLKRQSDFYNLYYSWPKQAATWTQFLTGITSDARKI